MQDTKIIKLLQSLSEEEVRRLGKFVRSPFYNYTGAIVQLYEHLKKYHPGFDSKKLEKEKVWKKLFPGEPFNDNKYWNLCFNFGKLLEKFLVAIHLELQPKEEKKILIKTLGQRNVYESFKKETNVYIQNLDAEPYRDSEYYADKIQLNSDYYFHPMTQKLTLKDDALLELMDSIDNRFILMKLRIGSEFKNREQILSKKYGLRFMDMVMQESMDDSFSKNATVGIYRYVYDLYEKGEGHEAYFQFKTVFEKSIQELRRWDQSMVATQLFNYAVRQINSGNEMFYKEAFELNKVRLNNGLLIENNRISEAAFGNIVVLGCRAEEYDWTFKFIEEYQQYLEEGTRENVVSLNIGLWHFNQNNFEKAYQYFSEFPYFHFYQPRARMNLIRTVFEQFLKDKSLFDVLMSQIESFEKFIYRSDVLTADLKKYDLNFLAILKKFTKDIIAGISQMSMKESLINELTLKKHIVGKDWLLKKINDLN